MLSDKHQAPSHASTLSPAVACDYRTWQAPYRMPRLRMYCWPSSGSPCGPKGNTMCVTSASSACRPAESSVLQRPRFCAGRLNADELLACFAARSFGSTCSSTSSETAMHAVSSAR